MAKKRKPGSKILEPSGSAADLLRSLRRKKKITGQELARRLGTSQATVSKTETGVQAPTVDYVLRFASELGLSKGETKELVARLNLLPSGLEADALLEPGSPELLSGDRARRQGKAVEHLEARASVIRVFQPLLVPDLLQTEEYARSTVRLSGQGNVEDAVRTRLKRQKNLEQKTSVVVLLAEGALRARVSSHQDMIAQLERLKGTLTKRNVRLGIIPFSTRLTALIPPGFSVFDESLAHVEVPHGRITLLKRRDVEVYLRVFDGLERLAVFGDGARSALDRVTRDFERIDEMESKAAESSV